MNKEIKEVALKLLCASMGDDSGIFGPDMKKHIEWAYEFAREFVEFKPLDLKEKSGGWLRINSQIPLYENELPSEGEEVFLAIRNNTYKAEGVAVGYLHYAAGDKLSPQFVIPACYPEDGHVFAWRRGVPDGIWKGEEV